MQQFMQACRKLTTDVEYTMFTINQKPSLAFSGGFYPEFDFLGRHLQNLGDPSRQLDLITVCSAHTENGWAFLFSWHKTSSLTCLEFIRSLASRVHEGERAEAALFRMVIKGFENIAVAPSWWEALKESDREQVCRAISSGVNLFQPTAPDYLLADLESIADWEIDGVCERISRAVGPPS